MKKEWEKSNGRKHARNEIEVKLSNTLSLREKSIGLKTIISN